MVDEKQTRVLSLQLLGSPLIYAQAELTDQQWDTFTRERCTLVGKDHVLNELVTPTGAINRNPLSILAAFTRLRTEGKGNGRGKRGGYGWQVFSQRFHHYVINLK